VSASVAATGCGVTHVLLPVTALLRRADSAAVIVSALAAKAQRGLGFRRITADLGRPGETVRGWLRRFAERAEAVRSTFTIWLRAVWVALSASSSFRRRYVEETPGAFRMVDNLYATLAYL
jgi:hypothetical protein